MWVKTTNISVRCNSRKYRGKISEFAKLHTDSYKDKFGPMVENKNPANDAMNRLKPENIQ